MINNKYVDGKVGGLTSDEQRLQERLCPMMLLKWISGPQSRTVKS